MAKREPRTVFISKGVELLAEWHRAQRKLGARGISQNELAKIVASTSGTLSKVAMGWFGPNLTLALALQTECLIPLDAWTKPASTRFVRALRRAAEKKAA